MGYMWFMENVFFLIIKNFFFIINYFLKDCLELENFKMVVFWKIFRFMIYFFYLDF